MNARDRAVTDRGAGVPKSGVLYTAHGGSAQRQKSYKTLAQKCIPFQEKCMIGSYRREVEERWVIPQQGLGSLL